MLACCTCVYCMFTLQSKLDHIKLKKLAVAKLQIKSLISHTARFNVIYLLKCY